MFGMQLMTGGRLKCRPRRGTAAVRLANGAEAPGFTLIEMIVVITIIALMAGLVLPNMAAIKHSRDLRTLAAAIRRMPIEARNQAAKTNDIVVLHLDGDSLVLDKVSGDNGESEEIERLPFGAAMQVQSAQKGSVSSDPGSWKWQAYPDGTSDEGGLIFAVGKSQNSLWIPKIGTPYWISGGELPQPKDGTWTAGELLQRTNTTTGGGGNGR